MSLSKAIHRACGLLAGMMLVSVLLPSRGMIAFVLYLTFLTILGVLALVVLYLFAWMLPKRNVQYFD